MGSSLFVFLFSSLLLFQVSSRAVNISTSWTLPQEGFPHFFRYFQHPATWDDAKAVCNSFNAELFTVETDERRDAARAYLKELDVLDNVWCGLERVNNQAPFVWTGGGQGPVVGDAYWQEAHPLDPERLCVAIEPLQDYRWQSYPCSGPQISSFVCQLQVPDWATGPEGCLVNSLPSLTVTYLSETEIIELLSDCGLSGTKRIACKGGENQDDLIKRLSCQPLEDNHLVTRDWSTKSVRKWDTSTPSNAIGYTYQMTHSSNTRHKRESGATSPSTDILLPLQTEPSQPLHNLPDKTSYVPKLQTDNPIYRSTENTRIPLSVKEAVKEEIVGISAVHQSTIGPPTQKGSTHQLNVKNWLQTLDNQLASTINTLLSNIQVTTSEAITTSTRVTEEVTTQTTTTTSPHHTTSEIRVKGLPPTLIQPKMQKKITEKVIDDDRKEIVNQVLDSNTGETEFIQIKEDVEALVEGKSNFDKVSGKEILRDKIIKGVNIKPSAPIHPEEINVSAVPILITEGEKKEDKHLKEIKLEISTDHPVKLIPIGDLPIKMNPPKLIEAVPTLDRPLTEVTSKGIMEFMTEKKTTSEHKNTEAPAQTTTKIAGHIEESDKPKKVMVLSAIPENPTKEPITNTLKVNKEPNLPLSPATTEPNKAKTSTITPMHESNVNEANIQVTEIKKSSEPLQTSTLKPTSAWVSPNTLSSPLTSTYWPKIEPPSSTRSASTNQPIIEKTEEISPTKMEIVSLLSSTVNSLRQDVIPPVTIISTPSPIKGSSTKDVKEELLTIPKLQETSPVPFTTSTLIVSTLNPLKRNDDNGKQETSTHKAEPTQIYKDMSTTKPTQNSEIHSKVLQVTPTVYVEKSTTIRQIHPDVEVISHDIQTPVILMKSMVPAEEKYSNEENLNTGDGTTELAFSDESSEEAENPKRSARGRLFPHSNPLSFYPYFLNRVLG